MTSISFVIHFRQIWRLILRNVYQDNILRSPPKISTVAGWWFPLTLPGDLVVDCRRHIPANMMITIFVFIKLRAPLITASINFFPNCLYTSCRRDK